MDEVEVVAVVDGEAVDGVDEVRNVDSVERVEEVKVVDVVAVFLVVLHAAVQQLVEADDLAVTLPAEGERRWSPSSSCGSAYHEMMAMRCWERAVF